MGVDQPIVVTNHAVRQARFRFRSHGWPTGERATEDRVRLEVADALEAGRVYNHKPREFRLFRERGRRKSGTGEHSQFDDQHFLVSADGRRGYTVKRELGTVVVTTCMCRAWGTDDDDELEHAG